ncbi:MAG TPA: GDSL-type esterase/lipase family protein, partial [Victivallales bacterium]|nr:GDSL-type esterase/lipase family protein [Victivallales bacterium]
SSVGFMRVLCPGKGKIQFFHKMEAFDERKAFKVSIRAKSLSKAPVKFLIQAMGTPRSFASADIQTTEQWKDYSATLAGGPTDVKNVGFIIYAPGPNTLDISSIKLEEISLSEYTPETMIPIPRPDNWWLPRHNRMVEIMKKEKPDFIIMGDSITAAWEAEGKDAWLKNFADLKSCSFGNGGDRVEHLLWRVLHSGIGNDFQPKLVAILIGVNNLFNSDATDIAMGTKNLIDTIIKMSPQTKILLIGIFPVGEKPEDIRRQMIKNINAQYAKLANNKDIFYIDFGNEFLEADGSISTKLIRNDYVHLTAKGYEKYAEKLLPKVKEILKK